MIISCPECKARYNVKDSLVSDKGKNVRCKKCKIAFRAYPDGTSKRLVEKKAAKTKVKPEVEVPKIALPPLPIDVAVGEAIHSTVRIDATALQEAMKKQRGDEKSTPKKIVEHAEPQEEPSFEVSSESSSSVDPLEDNQHTDAITQETSFDEASSQQPSFEAEPEIPAFSEEEEPALQTQAHSVMSFESTDQPEVPESTPDLEEPQHAVEDPFQDETPVISQEESFTPEDPFSQDNSEDEAPGISLSDEAERDPLSDSGNFGFEGGMADSFNTEDSASEPSLFDQSEDVAEEEGPELDIPEDTSVVEEAFTFEAEVEVPEEQPFKEEIQVSVFDVSIDGSVYPKIELSTLDRWIKEGRILEKDQVSISGTKQFDNADSFPELQACFQSYFQTDTNSSGDEDKQKKKGFFAKLFGR